MRDEEPGIRTLPCHIAVLQGKGADDRRCVLTIDQRLNASLSKLLTHLSAKRMIMPVGEQHRDAVDDGVAARTAAAHNGIVASTQLVVTDGADETLQLAEGFGELDHELHVKPRIGAALRRASTRYH